MLLDYQGQPTSTRIPGKYLLLKNHATSLLLTGSLNLTSSNPSWQTENKSISENLAALTSISYQCFTAMFKCRPWTIDIQFSDHIIMIIYLAHWNQKLYCSIQHYILVTLNMLVLLFLQVTLCPELLHFILFIPS